ncbi:lasso peptide biosynthesis PqqD family chaperone [Neobacillus rhizosphaerae]|uniref:lasso peptide biosynthesis PqqD family chaperone n=1 Tax=Neobacillus rhizosphaerae TaxID=2880965 RepID=UPI003D2ACF72
MKVETKSEMKIVQVPGIIVSDMDGEKVMLCIKNGRYYNLGQAGGTIWELIAEPLTIEQIVNKLLNIYMVDEKECEDHVKDFITQLSNENLILMQEIIK